MLFVLRRFVNSRAYSSTVFAGRTSVEVNKLVPEITSVEYTQRRLNLAKVISDLSPNISHAILVPGLSLSYSAPDVPHLFRQRASFRYLTGITDPNACLLISVTNPGCQVRSTVFYEQTNEEIRVWEGKRLDGPTALSISGADGAHPINEFPLVFQNSISPPNKSSLWFDDYNLTETGVPPMSPALRSMSSSSSFISSYGSFRSVSSYIHQLRVVKSPQELAHMRYACRAAANSMAAAAKFTPQATHEFALESTFEHAVKTRYDCRRLSFPPVVASGENATALHYLSNEKRLLQGDTVLMDAGCEFRGYCSDMCRVWPIGGTFSFAQRSLYEALRSVHEQCLNLVRPGIPLELVYTRMLDMIGAVAKELGIIRKSSHLYNMPTAAIGRRLCPHHVSHHLGLDVHDCSLVSRSEPVLPNSVVTVEPGIYIRPEWKKDYYEEFLGVGMRLEDDVIVCSDPMKPIEVLTSDFPMNTQFVQDLCKSDCS